MFGWSIKNIKPDRKPKTRREMLEEILLSFRFNKITLDKAIEFIEECCLKL